jgi:hypothetical protein
MRALPAATKQLLEKVESDHEIVVLIELRHPQIGEPIRLANSLVAITSKGEEYIAFPFTLDFPDIPGSSSKGRITVQNVDRRIGLFLQSLRSPPMIEIMVVASNDWDTWLLHVRKLWLRNIRGDAITVSADIDTWDFSTEPWPSKRVTQSRFPAVFR